MNTVRDRLLSHARRRSDSFRSTHSQQEEAIDEDYSVIGDADDIMENSDEKEESKYNSNTSVSIEDVDFE